ncbi:E3 ubiquitin-protein ligase TRIM71-like [Saccostrea echinata]|uniref:E3 ubiquitin-protein ligase TRIM71-like n=1 Tax=Saccostrea echinata TaxID=191078 RepID=UPI002A83A821|nr:E3 ubiquitin-protein ligase TRIM71-like [Saccostrea echinata]
MDPRTTSQDVIRCDLCDTAIVQMYCDVCLINLCKSCVGEHISDESNDHQVAKFQCRKTIPLYPVCASHEKEQCEMYCKHCDIPVCLTCLASDEHLGHKLSKILHALGEKKDLIRKEQTELKETIYPTYQNIAADVQNRMCQLEKEYGEISTTITKHGEDWHRKIDKLVRKLKTQIDEMKASQLQTLKKYLEEIKKKIVDIKDVIDSLDIAANSKNISIPLSVKSRLNQYESLPQIHILSVPNFTPGTTKGEELSKLFGHFSSIFLKSEEHEYGIKTTQKSPKVESSFVEKISPDIGSRLPVKKLLETPMIVVKNISYSCRPRNVAHLRNEKIWVCGGSSTLALYNLNQYSSLFNFNLDSISRNICKGSPLKTITTKSGNGPADIAVSRNGYLIYTDYKDKTVNIVKNEGIEEVIRLQNWGPRGVCSTFSGELLITMESEDNKQSKVVRYSDSTEKQSIQFDDEGAPLYSSGGSDKRICENRNLDICVADCGAKAVVVVNQAGNLRFGYTGHTPAPKNKPFNPTGITTDSQGHILISDDNNDCVHIINEDGQFLNYISCNSIITLCGLCTDADDNLFLIGFRVLQFIIISSCVKKIKYLE